MNRVQCPAEEVTLLHIFASHLDTVKATHRNGQLHFPWSPAGAALRHSSSASSSQQRPGWLERRSRLKWASWNTRRLKDEPHRSVCGHRSLSHRLHAARGRRGRRGQRLRAQQEKPGALFYSERPLNAGFFRLSSLLRWVHLHICV